MKRCPINSPKTNVSIIVTLFCLLTFIIPLNSWGQEKGTNPNLKIKNTSFQYSIDKNTKDEELNWIKEEVNKENIALLNFSKIKRNNAGELIAISTGFKDNRGSSQEKYQYNSNGISPFMVEINQNSEGEKYLKIINLNQGHSFYDNLESANPFSNKGTNPNILDEDIDVNFDDVMSKTMKRMNEIQQEMLDQQNSFLQKFTELQEKNDKKDEKNKK